MHCPYKLTNRYIHDYSIQEALPCTVEATVMPGMIIFQANN